MKKVKVILSTLMAVIIAFGCVSVASAAIVDEQNETNGTMETADAFAFVDTAKGKINSSDDVDWYCFETTEDGLITVTLTHTVNASASTYFKVEIYNENAKAEASFSSKGDAEKSSSPAFGSVAGKHYVKVQKGDVVDSTLSYEISVAINTDALCELEANDTYDKATEITVTGFGPYDKYVGTIPSEGNDIDYFKFEVTKPGYVYFYVENDADVKGEYNVELQTWINGNDGVAISKTIGAFTVKKEDTLVQSPGVGVAAGDYYLAINGTEGGYKVYVGFAESEKRESEYNDTIYDADLIANGGALWGSLFDKNDKDYFKFTVDADKSNYKISLAAYKENIDAQWFVSVYDANNTMIDSATASNTNGAAIELKDLSKGTYYIKVESGAIDSIELYQVGVEYTGKEEPPKGFFDLLGAIEWDVFIGNFSGWIEQINFMGIIASITASLIAILARLG